MTIQNKFYIWLTLKGLVSIEYQYVFLKINFTFDKQDDPKNKKRFKINTIRDFLGRQNETGIILGLEYKATN